MALSELPPWLNVAPFASPSDVLSQASAAAARRAATELAQRELAQRGQQFQETLNQRNMELAQRQALAQLEQAGVERQMAIREGQLGLEQQKQSAEAQEAAIRFQGMQGLQADLAAGVPYTEAYLRHLPKIAFGSPQTIASAGGREEANAINLLRAQDTATAKERDDATKNSIAELNAENRMNIALLREQSKAEASLKPLDFQEFLKQSTAVLHDKLLDADQKIQKIRDLREAAEKARITGEMQPLPVSNPYEEELKKAKQELVTAEVANALGKGFFSGSSVEKAKKKVMSIEELIKKKLPQSEVEKPSNKATAIGDVEDGYMLIRLPRSDRKNWKKVE